MIDIEVTISQMEEDMKNSKPHACKQRGSSCGEYCMVQYSKDESVI